MKYFLLFGFLVLAACKEEVRTLYDIKKENKLRVVLRNSPTTYFENRDGEPAGFEFEMLQEFAKWLKVDLEITTADSTEQLLESLELKNVDLAIGSLTITEARKEKYLFTTHYLEVNQEVICHKSKRIKNLKELASAKVIVAKNTSYAEILQNLKEDVPNLTWVEDEEDSQDHTFEQVQEQNFDCTIIDSNIRKMNQMFYPDLRFSFVLGKKNQIAWAMNKGNNELQSIYNKWFNNIFKKSSLKSLSEKYYATTQDFDPYDINKFNERVKSRLPKYKKFFQEEAQKIGWDWKLLAAISYQESHWNEKAVSPTGVRGLMMLTRITAKAMGVKNRRDPQQSIAGGAKYLKKIYDRLPNFIKGNSRLWMTLASYNVGYSHLRDARGLAAWRDRNPNTWGGVRAVLPLLSQKKYFKKLPHGYARGKEPVVYVDRIKNYYELIQKAINGTVKVKIYN